MSNFCPFNLDQNLKTEEIVLKNLESIQWEFLQNLSSGNQKHCEKLNIQFSKIGNIMPCKIFLPHNLQWLNTFCTGLHIFAYLVFTGRIQGYVVIWTNVL